MFFETTLADFAHADTERHLPVVRELPADLLTPVGAMLLGAVLVVAGLMVDPQFDLGGDDAPVDDVPRTSDGVEVW